MTTLNTIIEEENVFKKIDDYYREHFDESMPQKKMYISELLTTAMQRAYEAGVEDSKFHVEDNCDWFNKNNPIPDEEFHKNFEHSEMLRGVVKATCDELKAKTLTHLDQLKKEIKEKTPCNTNKK